MIFTISSLIAGLVCMGWSIIRNIKYRAFNVEEKEGMKHLIKELKNESNLSEYQRSTRKIQWISFGLINLSFIFDYLNL